MDISTETWIAFGTWSSVLAELLVAGVIYAELRAGRTLKAFEAAFDNEVYHGRSKLYEEFLSASSASLKERQREFLERIAKKEELREAVDSQIKQFAWLGYLLHTGVRKWLPSRWQYGPKAIVASVSHIVAPLAVMLLPYIELRVKYKGRECGRYFIGLAVACIPQTYDNGIELFHKDMEPASTVIIGRADLEATRTALKALL